MAYYDVIDLLPAFVLRLLAISAYLYTGLYLIIYQRFNTKINDLLKITENNRKTANCY